MVAGTFHVPSAMKKSLVFGATALGACLLLCYGTRSVPLLCSDSRGVRELSRLRVQTP